MNDSPYGLTASVWTNAEANAESEQAFLRMVDELHTGTVFLNRCDYLDPALAWTGVKNSGRGVSLSVFGEWICSLMSGFLGRGREKGMHAHECAYIGYDQLTRAKSVHMKVKTSS